MGSLVDVDDMGIFDQESVKRMTKNATQRMVEFNDAKQYFEERRAASKTAVATALKLLKGNKISLEQYVECLKINCLYTKTYIKPLTSMRFTKDDDKTLLNKIEKQDKLMTSEERKIMVGILTKTKKKEL
ncbi:hypothetical protein QTN25_001046 [Entamoeba marina]